MTPEPDLHVPLAHSPVQSGAEGDPYARHVEAVRREARMRAECMLRHATNPLAGLLEAIDAAATFHDLGKLDPDNQAALRKGRASKLPWDHIDAGVAHLSEARDWMAAWLVRGHHAPGLPERQEHFNPDGIGRRLRGRRRDDAYLARHEEQIARTNECLRHYVETHEACAGHAAAIPRPAAHGLTMRLALSCLVDADHSDAAFFDSAWRPFSAPGTRWAERLDVLSEYVAGLPKGTTRAERARNRRRDALFNACLESQLVAPMASCEAPVGLGKTTAVSGYLIRRALDEGLRRLIVVAPYTTILTQTAQTLRRALVLPGERPTEVVVEHHHRADFEQAADRQLAVLWQAPVVLTTAVSFFETLAGCGPGALRKLHAVPGSAIFVDEAHASLPAHLWPQNWKWLLELALKWGCRFVFGSGSLVRFWECAEIVGEPVHLPDLLPAHQAQELVSAERRRIRYARLAQGSVVSVTELIRHVTVAPGPWLVILNTVQTAAVVARAMREAGVETLHLSTALTPHHRARILKRVMERLRAKSAGWALVATSCIEAGVDLSFRSAFRERFTTASIIQTGGRVNRHGEYSPAGGGTVYDFALAGAGVTQHPAAAVAEQVLRELMESHALGEFSPADTVTEAMRRELAARGGLTSDAMLKAEAASNYPAVKQHGRVIAADTRVVVVDERLKQLLRHGRRIGFQTVLSRSVQLWARKIDKLGLELVPGHRELYSWEYKYEPEFLGCMAGILQNQEFWRDGGGVI